MPSNDCNEAPLFCGFFIDQYWGSTALTSLPAFLPDFCGSQEIPQYFRVFACSWELDMVIEPTNCLFGNGIQIALYDSCMGNVIACDPGQIGGAGLSLHLNAPTVPNTEYLVMIDGYAGDICDFHITVNSGLDMAFPGSGGNQQGQDGYIEFEVLPCGPAQLTAHLPTCLGGGGSGGCSVSWETSLVTNDCISFDWNLPPGVQIVSDDPNASTITIQLTQPVVDGVVSVSTSVSNCGEVCPTCLDGIGCLSGTIPPITISSDSSTYTYRPCQSAPSYCINTLDGATISTLCTFSGFGWLDQLQPNFSGQNDFCFPVDNPNLYEFSACENNITLNLTVSNCEHGRGLEFAVMHGFNCDYFEQMGSCVTIKENKSGQLTFPNLYPGQPIYLVVDGLDFDACEFHVEVADGNNVAAPVSLETSCQPEITAPVSAICTGGTYTFSIQGISGTGCPITGWSGVFNSCAPPLGACQLFDSMVVNWTLPSFLHVIGSSAGAQITVWVDSTFAGVDTLFNAMINADILSVATPTGTIDGFCGCSNFSKQFEAEITVDFVSEVNEIPLKLDCTQPCKTYNGVTYCDPGEYNLSQTGCVTNKLVVTKDPLPVVSAPSIQQNGNDYTVSFDITPSAGSVVTGGQGTLQNGTFVSMPIACGVPYSFEVNTAACSQPVAGAALCYLPPDCTNFNLPAPLGDSCHEAPLLCGNFLDGYCSSTAGLLPDQPAYLTSPLPDFENNGWLRFSPCEDSIAIDFQVFDCQTGNELGFFLLSGDCDTMTPLAFVAAVDGGMTSMNVGGLTPGEVYYLVIDGFYGAECKFQTHVVSGIGTALPGAATCDCTDGYIDGPDDLCPADIAVYTLIDPVCTITSGPPIGGNGIFCPPPPEACPSTAKDSVVLHWVIPSFMSFLSDSINVNSITVQVDSSLLGIDTVLMGTVSVYWEHIPLPGVDTAAVDTNAFCSCTGIACFPIFQSKDVTVHHDVDYEYGVLSCNAPCYFYNGQQYCQPGNYLVSQTNCLTQYLILVDNFSIPNISAGSDQTICLGDNATIGGNPSSGPLFAYSWSNGGNSPQINVAPQVTTTYFLTVTNTFNGCTATDNVTVFVIPPIISSIQPTVTICEGDCILFGGEIICPVSSGVYTAVLTSWLGCDSIVKQTIILQPPAVNNLGIVGTLTCAQPCVTFNGQQYCQPGTYSVTGNCEIQEFQIAEDLAIPTVQLGVVGTLTCAQPCVTFNGQEYCQPGTYSVTGNCEIQEFQIAEDLSIPTVQLGVVGTLTCAQPCVTFGGQQYCQPGTYSVTGNCEIQEFQIAEDLAIPTVQLGVVGTLTCAQPCVTFNGQEYCQSGTYSVTVNCEIQEFQIAEDLSLPTVQLGVVGTLTCLQPCLTYGGQEYCQSGTYSVTNNCEIQEFEITASIQPTLDLGVDKTIVAGESVELEAQTDAQPDVISWYGQSSLLNDTGLTITVQPFETTLYALEILDMNGCLLKDSVWVFVTPVPKNWYAPNVFQPGSTGINAYFTLFSADGVVSEIRSLEIYNRWGELVFVRQHFAPGVPELGWDGYGKGKMLDPAVFVWHAELLLSDGTSTKVKGDVTLVR